MSKYIGFGLLMFLVKLFFDWQKMKIKEQEKINRKNENKLRTKE